VTDLSCHICWQCKFETKCFSKKKHMSCCDISFKTKFISSHTNVHMLYFYPTFVLLCCSLLFSRSPSSNADRQQSHYSDGSNFNSGCNIFVFLQNQHLNYTWSVQQYLRNFLSANVALYENCRISKFILSLRQTTAIVWSCINAACL